MTILALEFSSPQRSVALMRGNSVFESVETGGRNTAAFGMIDKVLAEAKIEREEIGAIAVGLGPGSYTGIRSAIAIAQGWQLARDGSRRRSPHHNLKLIGVSSVEAIATQVQAGKFFGDVNVVVDAQRGEIYLARFEILETAVKEIEPLRIVSPLDCGDMSPLSKRGHVRALQNIFPSAATIAKLASSRSNFVAGEKLEPIYLRKTEFVKSPPPRIISGQ
jgi:tRNA threonylcarbamoyladenosine biosynthesis protein TsaB